MYSNDFNLIDLICLSTTFSVTIFINVYFISMLCFVTFRPFSMILFPTSHQWHFTIKNLCTTAGFTKHSVAFDVTIVETCIALLTIACTIVLSYVNYAKRPPSTYVISLPW